jgi:hypothetical protein
LNPAWTEPYVDVEACFERLLQVAAAGKVPDWASEAVAQFLKEQRMLEAGTNPDGVGAFDDARGA